MVSKRRRNGAGEDGRKYSIFRVGFPAVIEHLSKTENTIARVAEMMHHFVPEAQVLPCNIFGDKTASYLSQKEMNKEHEPILEERTHISVNSSHSSISEGARSDAPAPRKLNEGGEIEDAASAITSASSSLWLALIDKEVLALLNLIHSNVNGDRIFLVGYGLGGIVIKRAIVLANTLSQYKNIAFKVYRLVFFSTPHRDGEKREWERVIKDIMQVADAESPRRLPEILFELFQSLSQISQGFHKFAVKYPITNFIEKSDESAAKPMMGEGELANDMDDVERGLEKELHNLTLHEIATLDHLETLRTLLGLNQACTNGLTSSHHDYGGICDYKYLLHRAAQDNKLETFMALLRLSENASEANDEGMTLLHMAAAGGSTSMISLLLGKCTIEHEPTSIEILSPLDKQDNKLRTPLIMAAIMGHEEATKLLLQSGANISIQDDTGKTALHYGALKSLVAVEDFISSYLASLCDNSGCTPLHIAANSVDSDMAFKLADVLKAESRLEEVLNCKDKSNKTPLQYAAGKGHSTLVDKLFRHLDDTGRHNYRLEVRSSQGDRDLPTLPDYLSRLNKDIEAQALIAASEDENEKTDVVKRLLEHHAWKKLKSSEGKTPLHLAIADPMAVEALLKAGADPDVVDEKSQTPLHLAAQGGFLQSVRYLLKHKANARKLDNDERPPLYHAIINDHLLTVQEFFKHDETLVDLSTQIPLAMESRASTVFEYFLSLAQNTVDDFANFKTELLYDTVVKGSVENLDFLLQLGFDANLQRQGSSPLHWAAKGGCEGHIRSLIKFNARVDARDSRYRTPLHYAAEEDADDAVNVLLDKGSDINAQDNDVVTPIYLATKSKAYFALEKLIEYKADTNIATFSQGWTPLHASINRHSSWLTKLLLDAGADPNLAARDGRTPLHIAISMERKFTVKLLLEHGADRNILINKGTEFST